MTISERTAMRLAGHKTRSVIDRYDIISSDDLRSAAERLSGVSGTKVGHFAKSARTARADSADSLAQIGGAARN